jgi:hypothetical protein
MIVGEAVLFSGMTHLAFSVGALIVAVRSGTKGSTKWRTNTTPLGEVLFALLFTDLHLLLFTTTTQLIRLEGALGLEVGPAMLWDVSLRHDRGLLLFVCREG